MKNLQSPRLVKRLSKGRLRHQDSSLQFSACECGFWDFKFICFGKIDVTKPD